MEVHGADGSVRCGWKCVVRMEVHGADGSVRCGWKCVVRMEVYVCPTMVLLVASSILIMHKFNILQVQIQKYAPSMHYPYHHPNPCYIYLLPQSTGNKHVLIKIRNTTRIIKYRSNLQAQHSHKLYRSRSVSNIPTPPCTTYPPKSIYNH